MMAEEAERSAVKALRRYALGVEYNGSRYRGWQIQDDVASVQGELQRALSKIANEPVAVICAGRTDAGVHATQQIIHFETAVERPERAWVLGTNSNLPPDICVRWATPVDDEFHARFSALERRYRYVIYNAPVKPALLNRELTWTHHPLDEQCMQEAALYLVGEHDFTSYRAVGCQAHSPIRTVKHLYVRRLGELLVIDIRANAFLHHMVRNIAGVLMRIGAGEAEPSWAKEVLEARDRRLGGVTAPPYGLYFVDVQYPERFALPKLAPGPAFLPQLSLA